ncbi:MAG: hypothetical protein ABSF88_09290 [Candidatus Aminicenantales bacterium]
MKTIPFMDLRPEYEEMSGRIDGAIRRVIKRGRFIMGEELRRFGRKVKSL